MADLGSSQRLPRFVCEGMARELAHTGRTFKGEDAQSIGFVNRSFEDRAALKDAVASSLAAKSPTTLRGIKETMNFSRDRSVAEGLNFVASEMQPCSYLVICQAYIDLNPLRTGIVSFPLRTRPFVLVFPS